MIFRAYISEFYKSNIFQAETSLGMILEKAKISISK